MWRIIRYFGSSPEDKILVLKIACLLYGFWIGLRLFRLQSLYRFLQRFFPSQGSTEPNRETLENITSLVEKVGGYLLGEDSCFPQALVGQLLLSRIGFKPTLQIGVLKEKDGCLHAHAWVVVDGKVVIGGPLSQVEKYIPLSETGSNYL